MEGIFQEDMLAGKRALVCGGSQGIGRACAEMLAGCGASVSVLGRDVQALQKVAQALPKHFSQQHDWIAVDMSHPEQVREKVLEALKGGVYHIVVNNSGGPAAGLLQDASLQQLQDAFVQHIGSAHTIMQCVRGGMQAVKYGRFINIISTSVKQPLPNLGVSNTIRGAMASWAKTLANELGPDGITVNNVLPGATKTGRLEAIIQNQSQKKGVAPDLVEQHMLEEIPAGRFAGPEEIAAAVVFLASPAGGYVNGINVPVDGGRTKTL